jgi:flavin-dependent dehydrogenase
MQFGWYSDYIMRIAIIGAGINGLYLAWKLAEKGENVTIFEKREKIGKQACSGLFSEKILKFIPQSQKLVQGEINSALIHFSKKTINLNFSEKFLIINHAKLDNLTAGLAENYGAEIVLKNKITQSFFTNLENTKYDKVIGCDGPLSETREFLGLKKLNFRLAVQGFIFTDKSRYSSLVETWPIKNGFIWKIFKGEKIEYGAIGNQEDVVFYFNHFLKKNNIILEEKKSALVPEGIFKISGNNKIAVCGDAAGLTKPWSGGGVVWGLIAADLLLKNFPNLLKYEKEAKRFFLPKIIFSKIITKTVYFLGFNIPWLIPKNVKIKGDFLI